MRLDYQIEVDARNGRLHETRRGQLVVEIDEKNIAHFLRLYTGESLAEGELLMNFRTRWDTDIIVGVDSFLFQEGLADRYAKAQYAEIRVTDGGTVMLIDLVGPNLENLVD